ncbi:MAG: PIN domain-containing protein [Candidatus Hodarchaeales archaeon]
MSGQKQYAVDTSVLVKRYYDPEAVNEKLLSTSIASEITLSEIYYVLCRKKGIDAANNYIIDLLSKLEIVPSETLIPIAGQLKCQLPISLADCWTLAAAKSRNLSALFAFREQELEDNLSDIRKHVKVVFLDEL